jgi:hypothetical protein
MHYYFFKNYYQIIFVHFGSNFGNWERYYSEQYWDRSHFYSDLVPILNAIYGAILGVILGAICDFWSNDTW